MNIKHRVRSSRLAAGMGMIFLLAGGTNLTWAQSSYTNPLRPAKRGVSDASGAERTAEAAEPPGSTLSRRVAQRPVVRQAGYQSAAGRGRAVRTTSLGVTVPRHATPGYVPRHQLMSGLQESDGSVVEPIPSGEPSAIAIDPLPAEGEILDPTCGVEATAPCTDCGYSHGCLIPCPQVALQNAEFMAGVHGFTGPANRGETGSFGFDWGINWGGPVPCTLNQAIGMQIGYRGTSSNFSGASFTEDTRTQAFVTAGLFRRVDWGFQGGVVVDYLKDDWYYDVSLTQIRGEISWVYPRCHELGFWFASGTRTDTVQSTLLVNGQTTTTVETFEPTDLYAFFYRRRFDDVGGGFGRIYAGFSGNSEGLIGADFQLPLTEDWALQTGFTYLIPEDDNNRISYSREAWNVGVTVVWYPGVRKAVGNDYFRPLFDVAHNGSFIVNRR